MNIKNLMYIITLLYNIQMVYYQNPPDKSLYCRYLLIYFINFLIFFVCFCLFFTITITPNTYPWLLSNSQTLLGGFWTCPIKTLKRYCKVTLNVFFNKKKFWWWQKNLNYMIDFLWEIKIFLLNMLKLL